MLQRRWSVPRQIQRGKTSHVDQISDQRRTGARIHAESLRSSATATATVRSVRPLGSLPSAGLPLWLASAVGQLPSPRGPARRLRALGGTLSAAIVPPCWFRLTEPTAATPAAALRPRQRGIGTKHGFSII